MLILRLEVIFAFIVILLFKNSTEFPTMSLTGADALTKNHIEITRLSTRLALGRFIQDNNLTVINPAVTDQIHIVDAFFGDDADGLQEYKRREHEIINVVNEQEQSTLAYVHCNSEQILLAHTRIVQLRNQIKDLAQDQDPDLPLIRENIGRCLYTIQAFYSTTNWIELSLDKTYRNFGVPGVTLLPVTGPDVDTCKDCDNSGTNEASCKDNLLVKDMLTSGYKTGQDVQPPYITNSDLTTGKCGFGGSSDTENGQRTARGGINKDRLDPNYSPHHHIHYQAFFAARQATEDFLIDTEIGITNELGTDVFAKVFNIQKRHRSSFGFTIDVTGSMADNIAEVKKSCTDIVTNIMGTANEPLDYVLVTFSDPVELTEHVLTTTHGLEMASKIESLTVTGGEDCPEFALDGLLKCIDRIREHSTLFFFSDAPAKDEDNKQAVIDAVNAKSIDLRIMITDLCIARKRRGLPDRFKRQTDGSAVYFEIAEATGGKVYQISTSEIPAIMQQITEEQFPSATAIIDTFSFDSFDTGMSFFPVDSMINSLKIEIVGAGSTGEVSLQSSLGSVLDMENATVLFESPNKVIVTVVNPTPGMNTLQRTGTNHWDVNITAQTALDFDYSILEDKEGYMYRVSGNPIFGKMYTVLITVYNLPENASISSILLSPTEGETESFNLTSIDSSIDATFYVTTTFNSEIYHVGIQGTDANGNLLKRTSPFMISTVEVGLRFLSMPELYVNTKENISYKIENFGADNETFIVSAIDNRALLTGVTDVEIFLTAGDSKDVMFQIEGSPSFTTVTCTVTVRKYGFSDVLQENSKTLFINQQTPPICAINAISGSCGHNSMNGSCSAVKWAGQAEVMFTTELTSVSGTTSIRVDMGTLTYSPLYVNVSGDCCMPSAYLTVIDKNSNFVRCHFNLGRVTYSPESKPVLSTEEKIAIGVIIGIVMACIIGLFVVAVLINRVKTKLDANKIENINFEAVKALPVQKDNSSKLQYSRNFLSLQQEFMNKSPNDTKLCQIQDLQVTELDW